MTAIGDVSVFLDPPSDEIPEKAAPEMAEQQQMMSMVLEYLKQIIPKLPDFYAKRFTMSFEETWPPKNGKGNHEEGAPHPVGAYRATVYYREGKEVVHEEGAHERGLVTRGVFGPILSTVIFDAA